jgi:hypothetical protein
MESTTFDAVTRLLANGLNRRALVRRLAAGGTTAATAGVLLGAVDEAAAKKNKKKDKKKKRCLRSGKPCKTNKQCCPDKTDNICDVPTGGSNSDTFCCGGEGAKCGGANEDGDAVGPKCCANNRCSTGDPDDPDFEPNTPGRCLAEEP